MSALTPEQQALVEKARNDLYYTESLDRKAQIDLLAIIDALNLQLDEALAANRELTLPPAKMTLSSPVMVASPTPSRAKLTPNHSRWSEFTKRLEGPEGCNFHKNESGKTVWTCYGGHDQRFARAILETMDVDVEATLAYFTENGGHCDCEILFNVEDATRGIDKP